MLYAVFCASIAAETQVLMLLKVVLVRRRALNAVSSQFSRTIFLSSGGRMFIPPFAAVFLVMLLVILWGICEELSCGAALCLVGFAFLRFLAIVFAPQPTS